MRVLFLLPLPPPYGGIANWSNLIKNYINHTNKIEAAYINIAPKNRTLDGRSIYERIVVSGFQMFKIFLEFRKANATFKPDIVHMTSSGQLAIIRDIFLLKMMKKLAVPSIYHLRFGRVPEIANANTMEWRLLKEAIKLSTVTITVDKATVETIHRHLPLESSIYVPNPFSYDEKMLLHESNPRNEVIFIGWVIKTKGIEELLSCWNCVFSNHNDWMLKIVGPYEEKYIDYLKNKFSMDGVFFIGEKDHNETLNLLKSAKIFVLPSYTEGFPNSILEAMAYGKGIVASNVGAIPDMLDNSCGIIINPRDENGISNAINNLIENDNLRDNYGKNAKNKVDSMYNIDTVFCEYLTIWKKALRN